MLNVFWKVGFFSQVHSKYRMWGFLENKNGLCEVDLISNKVKMLAIFEEERICQERLFHHIYCMGDDLVLLPGTAKQIYLYSLKNNKYIPFAFYGEAVGYDKEQYGFAACVGYKSKVFFLGCRVPEIVVWNRLNNEMKILKIPFDNICCKESQINGFCADGYVVDGNILLVALSCDNVLLKIDMESLEVESVRINIACNGFGGITGVCEGVWIEDSGDLLFYDRYNRKCRRIEICSKKQRQSFYAPICISNRVYLFPLYADKAYIYDIDRDAVCELEVVNEIICKKGRRLSPFTTLGVSVEDSHISFFSGLDFTWYRLDCRDESLSSTLLKLERDDEYYNRYITSFMQSDILIKEKGTLLLSDYLQCIKHYSQF